MDEGKDYSIGHLRAKYLDLANIAFAQENYIVAEGNIKNFLNTIPENSEAAGEIKKQFDHIMVKQQGDIRKLHTTIQDMGELEKTDVKNTGEMELKIETLHDKKVVCWNVAMSKGLLYE